MECIIRRYATLREGTGMLALCSLLMYASHPTMDRAIYDSTIHVTGAPVGDPTALKSHDPSLRQDHARTSLIIGVHDSTIHVTGASGKDPTALKSHDPSLRDHARTSLIIEVAMNSPPGTGPELGHAAHAMYPVPMDPKLKAAPMRNSAYNGSEYAMKYTRPMRDNDDSIEASGSTFYVNERPCDCDTMRRMYLNEIDGGTYSDNPRTVGRFTMCSENPESIGHSIENRPTMDVNDSINMDRQPSVMGSHYGAVREKNPGIIEKTCGDSPCFVGYAVIHSEALEGIDNAVDNSSTNVTNDPLLLVHINTHDRGTGTVIGPSFFPCVGTGTSALSRTSAMSQDRLGVDDNDRSGNR